MFLPTDYGGSDDGNDPKEEEIKEADLSLSMEDSFLSDVKEMEPDLEQSYQQDMDQGQFGYDTQRIDRVYKGKSRGAQELEDELKELFEAQNDRFKEL